MKPAMKSKCGWYGALLFSLYMRASFKSCRYPYVNSWFFAPQQNMEGRRLLPRAALMGGCGKVL